jgi:hypothetical protein
VQIFAIIDDIRQDIAALDRRAVTALVYSAFGLTCIYYLKDTGAVAGWLDGTGGEWLGDFITANEANNLPALAWWVVVATAFYFVGPLLIIRFAWNADVRDFGLKLRIESGFWKLLAACTALMLPLVYMMSLTEGFSAKYPFLRIYDGEPYIGRTLLIWELIYFVQFFGLEFFFRGFLAQPEAQPGALFDLSDDRAILHDPFWQAARGNDRGDRGGHISGVDELSQRQYLVRTSAPLCSRFLDGHTCPQQ